MSNAYWQVSAGYFEREYTEEFLLYGIAFVGADRLDKIIKVQADDRIILKRGVSEIIAVGVIVERDGKVKGNNDKAWLMDFDGWDLPAYCYVEWHIPEKPIKTKGLSQGAISLVHKDDLKKLAEQILVENPANENICSEPNHTEKVEDAEILEFLIHEGLRVGAAEELTKAFNRIRLLAHYYRECKWEDIREHETRTFLILPLLLALGWPEQQIKIELGAGKRRRIDVACFSKPYRRDSKNNANNEDCALILESKGFSKGLNYASDQGKEYAKHFPNCPVVIVSNGYCYKAYLRGENGEFQQKPSAYMNLLDPQDKYPLDPENVAGSLDLLRYLLPSSVIQLMQVSKI